MLIYSNGNISRHNTLPKENKTFHIVGRIFMKKEIIENLAVVCGVSFSDMLDQLRDGHVPAGKMHAAMGGSVPEDWMKVMEVVCPDNLPVNQWVEVEGIANMVITTISRDEKGQMVETSYVPAGVSYRLCKADSSGNIVHTAWTKTL